MTDSRKLLFTLGRPLSPLYSLLMTWRAGLYRRGILRQHRLPVPVVSIGNITLGGTGKTPLVLHVARFLLDGGWQPAIVSRGYGGRAKGPVNVVSDRRQVLLGADLAGDEPRLLAESLPGVPVLTGPARAAVGRFAVERFGADIVIMDDGFQHLALHRDLDLVLFNVLSSVGSARVFPGGELREPWTALRRADACVVTGVDYKTEQRADAFRRFLRERAPQAPVFTAEYLPVCLLHSGRTRPFAMEQGRRMDLCGFCGIANPGSFRRTLAKERFRIKAFRAFRDHHPYSREDVEELVRWAGSHGAKGLITTEKDFVKLAPLLPDFPVLAVKIEMYLQEEFDFFLTDRLGPFRK